MSDIYLIGEITVDFATDSVFLVHRVHGRCSSMPLGEGDFIEISNGVTVTVQNVLETIVEDGPDSHDQAKVGQSVYEGAYVRAKLNHKTTERLENKDGF